MDWQTPVAIAIAAIAAAYALWRWLRPLFSRPPCCGQTAQESKLLHIEKPD